MWRDTGKIHKCYLNTDIVLFMCFAIIKISIGCNCLNNDMKEIILTKGEKEALNVFYGLSEQEFLIICHLSQHGQKTVNELIDDEYLKLKKERAYKILSDMIEKGFVRSIEEGKTMEFLVCEPESMFSIIKKNKMDYLKENGKEIERKLCACLQSPVFERLGYDVVGTKKSQGFIL